MKTIDLRILEEHPGLAESITLQVSGSDLLSFADKLAQDTAQGVREAIQAENKSDELLTRQQVAEMLSVTLTSLWHWDKKDILKPVRIGSKVRYTRSSVEAALINKGGQGNE